MYQLCVVHTVLRIYCCTVVAFCIICTLLCHSDTLYQNIFDKSLLCVLNFHDIYISLLIANLSNAADCFCGTGHIAAMHMNSGKLSITNCFSFPKVSVIESFHCMSLIIHTLYSCSSSFFFVRVVSTLNLVTVLQDVVW